MQKKPNWNLPERNLLSSSTGLAARVAGGFAAVAGAAGSVAGSLVVVASFGAAGAGLSGVKMANRTGSVDEFEIKLVGDNHNQGRLEVGILVARFVLEEEDFMKPWYALLWESKNLIALSTAIQDWLTSRIVFELMKQGAMMTVLSTLLAALAWPSTLLTATYFIDSKWSITVDSFALNQVLHPRAKAAISVWICGFDEDFEAELVG